MATIDAKLSEFEFNKLVNEWVEFKKKSPSKVPRHLTYKLYNQMFNGKQRDVNACTCLDRDTDYKVTKQLEKYLKLDPLPIEANVKIDMSSMTAGGDKLKVYGEEEQDLVGELLEDNVTVRKIPDPVKPKRKYVRKKKTTTKTKTSK